MIALAPEGLLSVFSGGWGGLAVALSLSTSVELADAAGLPSLTAFTASPVSAGRT